MRGTIVQVVMLGCALAAGCAELHPRSEESDDGPSGPGGSSDRDDEGDVGGGAADGPDGGAGAAGDAGEEAQAAADAGADTPEPVTIVLGAGDMIDTYLSLDQPTINYGVNDRLCADTAGTDRAILIQFDLGAIGGATVTSATLRLWTGAIASDASANPYNAYRLLEAWDEGAQAGVAGTASWNQARSGDSWTTAGAGTGSRAAGVIGSFTPPLADTEYAMAISPTVVNGWIADPGSNHGLVIVSSSTDGACFDSSEFSDAAKRPTLTVVSTD